MSEPTAAPLIDSHCHIPLIGSDPELIIAEARAQGIAHMLCVSVELESFPALLALARGHDCLSASVGVHPNARDVEEPDVGRLLAAAADPKVIAIGETGLDYFRSKGDLDWQRARFRTHIRAARAAGKPLIIHSRDARHDVLEILGGEGAAEVGGIMHCFVDDWDTAKRAMDLNFRISFSGIVTFRNAAELQDVAMKVPLDRMLVETDSPYLAPVPVRGKENRPAYVRHVAEFIAVLRGQPPAEIAAATTANFLELFPAVRLL
jgi:TatD DNase family protein